MLEGSILQQLVTAHEGSTTSLNLGVYYKNTLIALCHALEDFILESSSNPLMITAFQQGKWYLQEADRYGEIAQKASQVVIMATPGAGFADHLTSRRDNVSLVSLDTSDPVAQEWHLMIFSPSYAAMVLCQELSPADYGSSGVPENDLERKFYGFWTFDPGLVQETVELAISKIGAYDNGLQKQLQTHMEQLLAEIGHRQRDDLGVVVSRVVAYLQTSHNSLAHSPVAALDNNLVANEMQAFLRLAELIDRADINNPLAAATVAAMSETMGQLLDLPAWQIKRLRLASLLHRLTTSLVKAATQAQTAPSCPLLPSVEALRIMPRARAIAEILIHQTESWDGSGEPQGLAYDKIPLESRIICLISYFQQQLTSYQKQGIDNPGLQALSDCQAQAGTTFDPKLVEALALIVMGMQQGMNIEVVKPKIASGMWLLDSFEEQAAPMLET